MGTLNLTAVTPDTPYIKKIKSALEKATGQSIPLVEIKKVQRKGGVSVVPIFLVFAGGQELTLFARASADVFKSELNGKEIVLAGDFSDDYQQTFDNAVSGMGKLIRESQAKVEQQNQKEKVKLPPRKNRSIQQQISDKREEETQLDQELSNLTAQRDQLLEQLKQAQLQMEGGEATQGKQIAEGQPSAFDSIDWDEKQHPRDEKGKFSVRSSHSKSLDASVTEKHFKQPSETFSIYDAGVPLMEPDTSTPLKKAIIDVENGIRNNELETGAAFNSDGVILFKRQGLPDQVTLTDHELSLLNNAVFSHNHPKGMPFSIADIRMAITYNIKEIRAVTPYLRYSMYPKNQWCSKAALIATINDVSLDANKFVNEQVRLGEINPQFAEAEYLHYIWVKVADRLNLNYGRERS